MSTNEQSALSAQPSAPTPNTGVGPGDSTPESPEVSYDFFGNSQLLVFSADR
jgi:hypothetical protein